MPPKKTKEVKPAKEAVEAPTAAPATVAIPPIVEDCKGVICAADPICSAAVGASKLCLGHHNGIVTLHDLSSGSATEIVEVAAHRGAVHAMIVVGDEPSHKLLLTASADGTLKAHAIPSGQWVMTFTGHQGPVDSLAVCGDRLFSGGSDGLLAEWNLKTGQLLRTLRCHVGRITALCVPVAPVPAEGAPEVADPPPNGTVVTASDDTLAKLIHLESKSVLCMMRGECPITTITYVHPTLFLGCTDGAVRGFNIHTAQNTALYTGHTDGVNALVAVRNRIFSASDDTTVRMWSAAKWQADHVFRGHVKSATCLAVDAEHGRLYSGGFECAARAWDLDGAIQWIEQVERAATDAAPRAPKRSTKKDGSTKKK